MKRRHHGQVDEASLQTDVMRFMAIVAFCLIAILAMVRNVEAPPKEVRQLAAVTTPAPVDESPEEVPQPLPMPMPPTPAPEPSVEIIEPEERVFVVRRAEVETPSPEPLSEVVEAEPVPEPVPEPVSEAITETPLAQVTPANEKTVEEPVAASDEATDAGLTLRFTSEADFLRLVARGKVAVYAFDESRFLVLEPDYQFIATSPPRQVYELDPGTIPAQMHSALKRLDGPLPAKWAVGLPERVQRQIQDYVASVQSGELLINRFEEVRHVAAR